eukprot:365740-Chlamydomonas_euryale.AAC.6
MIRPRLARASRTYTSQPFNTRNNLRRLTCHIKWAAGCCAKDGSYHPYGLQRPRMGVTGQVLWSSEKIDTWYDVMNVSRVSGGGISKLNDTEPSDEVIGAKPVILNVSFPGPYVS